MGRTALTDWKLSGRSSAARMAAVHKSGVASSCETRFSSSVSASSNLQ